MWALAMRRRRPAGRDSGDVVFGTIGWLFADLMFALAMAFLVATTVGQPKPLPGSDLLPSPTATPTPRPTPTPEPALDLDPVTITLAEVDYLGLLKGQAGPRKTLQKKIRSNRRLEDRRAGLVLTFGGSNGGSVGQAKRIAEEMNEVLRDLGADGFVFRGTVFEPYISLKNGPRTVSLDIYLFKR